MDDRLMDDGLMDDVLLPGADDAADLGPVLVVPSADDVGRLALELWLGHLVATADHDGSANLSTNLSVSD